MIANDVQNPPVAALVTRKDPDDRAQPGILLHIACQAGGWIPAGAPTHYLCGAPVRLLLGAIAPGDGPDGPGVCPICAALDHSAPSHGR